MNDIINKSNYTNKLKEISKEKNKFFWSILDNKIVKLDIDFKLKRNRIMKLLKIFQNISANMRKYY